MNSKQIRLYTNDSYITVDVDISNIPDSNHLYLTRPAVRQAMKRYHEKNKNNEKYLEMKRNNARNYYYKKKYGIAYNNELPNNNNNCVSGEQ